MNAKHTLDEIYRKIVQPLDSCSDNLNSVTGMLKYIQHLEKAKQTFDEQMECKQKELGRKYPSEKSAIAKYISQLKNKLHLGNSSHCVALYFFMDCFNYVGLRYDLVA